MSIGDGSSIFLEGSLVLNPSLPTDTLCALEHLLLASVSPSMRFGHWVSLGPGGLTVHGQVDWLAAADTDRVPDLTLVGSSLFPADAVPGQHPAVGGQAEADVNGQGLAIEEPADLSRAGAAADQAQGVSALHQLCVVGQDHGLGQDLCGARDRGGGGQAPPAPGASPSPGKGHPGGAPVPPTRGAKNGIGGRSNPGSHPEGGENFHIILGLF